jgi:hypothetical protein
LACAAIPDIEIQINKRQYLPVINNTRPAIPDIKVRINKRVPAMVIREIVSISWNVPDTDGGLSGSSAVFFILMGSGNHATSGNPAIPGNLVSKHPVSFIRCSYPS